MEKYRIFGDASTGIHPYTVVIDPKKWGVAVAAVMFPLRLLFCSALLLLLLATDLLSCLLYALYLGVVGRWVTAPLQRMWLRGVLFFAGHVLVSGEATPAAAGGGGGGAAAARRRRAGGPTGRQRRSSPSSLRRGDVVFANLQSVLDVCVLEVALGVPYYTLAFPSPAGAEDGSTKGGSGMHLVLIGPGPFQRLAAWRHIRRTGTLQFLKAAAAASGADVDLAAAQARAATPILYFAEGTCSNGKGVLAFPGAVRMRSNSDDRSKAKYTRGESDDDDDNDDGGAAVVSAAVASVTYDTPAVQNVVSEGEGALPYLFRVSKLMYGSASPAWASPFFPRAHVQFTRAVSLDGARRVEGKEGEGNFYLLTTAAVDALRDAMCTKGGRRGGGGAGPVRRQPLRVGLREKVGFVETYIAVTAGDGRNNSN